MTSEFGRIEDLQVLASITTSAAETAAALAAMRNQVIEEMLSRLGAVSPDEISPPVPKAE